ELRALGLEERLRGLAIENEESLFFTRHGQLVYREARGRQAGYAEPELGIHRGALHRVLYETACERLGAGRILLGRQCVGIDQDDRGVRVRLASRGSEPSEVAGDILVACDGVNSTVRRAFYPDEKLAFTGINTWRGVTRRAPILGGRSYLRIGTIDTGKI